MCAGRPGDAVLGDVIVAQRAYQYDEGKWNGAEFWGDHDKFRLTGAWLRAAQDFRPEGLPSYGRASAGQAGVWFMERLYRGEDPRRHPAFDRYFSRDDWPGGVAGLVADGLVAPDGAGWVLTEAGWRHIARLRAEDVHGPATLPFKVLAGAMASGSAVVEWDGIWDELRRMGERKIVGMEMEAATVAAAADELGVPHWLVAKGVMDHAGADRDDRFKEFAARASAEVLFALLGRLLPARPPERPAGKLPGAVRLDVVHRLVDDWVKLADLAEVPRYDRARFPAGDEPRRVLDWLEERGRLAELPELLDKIDRPDLATLTGRYLPGTATGR
ncbi:hypothetical protein [Paractinoplanes durhamensis]|uniref:hypothetical protein n=1 Tax=Paractinoplanes durhamensis TaxID=113563 RepID=UPI0036413B2B